MATCRTCNNFYMGSECPFCRVKRMTVDPEEIRRKEERKIEAQRLEEQRKKQEEYIQTHYEELSKVFLMTTGNSFSGYEITDYLGIVSDGVVQGTGWISEISADWNDLFGTESNTFAKKMKICREAALQKAKDSAIRLGANALLSIDFETSTFRNNMIGIMVTGTAVKVEKSTT